MLKATIHKYGDLAGKTRGLRPVVKEALQAAVVAWHHGGVAEFKGQTAGFLPFHFSKQAFYRYTDPSIYKPRTRQYEARKQRKWGHNDPLVFSGQTKRAAMMSIRVTGTSQRARGIMTGTNVLNFQGRGVHNLRDELLATNAAEEQALADGVEKMVEEFLNREDDVKTERA